MYPEPLFVTGLPANYIPICSIVVSEKHKLLITSYYPNCPSQTLENLDLQQENEHQKEEVSIQHPNNMSSVNSIPPSACINNSGD
jgi:hypothetical protein